MDRTQYLKDLRRIYDLAKNGERPCWVGMTNVTNEVIILARGFYIETGFSAFDISKLSASQLSFIADAVQAGKLQTKWSEGGRNKPKPPAVVIDTADRLPFHRGRGRTALDAMKEPASCPMCEAGVPARQMEQLRVRKETDKSGRVYYRRVRVGEAREGDLIMHRYFTPAPTPAVAVEDLAKGEGIKGGEIPEMVGADQARGKVSMAGVISSRTSCKEPNRSQPPRSDRVRCECGAASVGSVLRGPAHSDWCPMRKE